MPTQTQYLFNQRYRIRETSFSDSGLTVYSAIDTVDKTDVTIKEINVPLRKVTTAASQEAIRQNFAKHAKMLASLDHPSLIRVRNFFSDFGRHYLVMDSVEGDDLLKLRSAPGEKPSLPEILGWMDQVLDAINCLHNQRPPINRNCIEPRSLIRTLEGNIKLAAFGISDDVNGMVSTEFCVSMSGSKNINYRPLEEIWKGLDPASKKVISNRFSDNSGIDGNVMADVRSDIYSVGATFYHILTGKMPTDALERSIEILDGNSDPLVAPNVYDPSIPVEISDALMRSLAIKRDERFDSPAIMRQVLKTAVVRIKERSGEAAFHSCEPSGGNLSAQPAEPSLRADLLEIGRPIDFDLQNIPSSLIETVSESAAPRNAESILDIQPVSPRLPISEDRIGIFESSPVSSKTEFAFATEDTGNNGSPKFIWAAAAGAAIILVGIASFFVFMPPDNSGAAQSITVQELRQSSPVVAEKISSEEPVPATESSEKPIAANSLAQTASTTPTETVTESKNAGLSRQPPVRNGGSSEKPIKSKKKITVDDLINDN